MLSGLLLQEAGLQDDAATLDFAIYLLWIVGQADTLNLGSALDNHRRASHLQILDNGYRIAVHQLGTVAILRYIVGCRSRCVLAIELVRTIGAHIQRSIKIYILSATLRALCNLFHIVFGFVSFSILILLADAESKHL